MTESEKRRTVPGRVAEDLADGARMLTEGAGSLAVSVARNAGLVARWGKNEVNVVAESARSAAAITKRATQRALGQSGADTQAPPIDEMLDQLRRLLSKHGFAESELLLKDHEFWQLIAELHKQRGSYYTRR
ncbi:MAG: hypothetical protein GY854_24135 [Deltaproteobacteria bacterium]|nr:hypothetical protein [Deltaproteobacteria bacterium]